MKYFAKYIPVEGEIKDANYYFHPSWGLTLCGEHSTKNGKLAKLFLCSRDIQIDDKVKWQGSGDKWFDKTIIGEREGEWLISSTYDMWVEKRNVIKVIGQISLEAIWVKECDEFGEDEWEFYSTVIDAPLDKRRFYDHPIIPPDEFCIIIKGPCGHFH